MSPPLPYARLILTVAALAMFAGCVPNEEPAEDPTIVIVDDPHEAPQPPVCGDGVVEGDEVCDDGVNDEHAGSCLADCSAEAPTTCGNGLLDQGEHCDGTQGMVSCSALGFDGGGTSQCTSTCALDVSTCSGVRRLPGVQGSPRGVSADNRYAIYEEVQLECDGSTCYGDPGEPGVIRTLDLIGGEVISHGEELATISMTPIDAERFWILADWNRDDHHGQLQIRRFDGRGDPIVVASRVSLELFDGTHPTHLSYVDTDGVAWVVPHGGNTPEKIFVADRWITELRLGPDGRTALIDADDQLSWLDFDGGRIDFDGSIAAVSPDGRWAVISSSSPSEHRLISMADGSVMKTEHRHLESALFSASSNFLYVREDACTSLSRTRVISLPDGEETSFGECARYHTHGLPPVTEDDRWLMQSRWLIDEERYELLFTDLDTRETTTIPYHFVSEDQRLPMYAYERTSEQLIFSGVRSDDTGPWAHRLELRTGELHALPDSFEGTILQDGGWLIALRVNDPDVWTWDRYFLAPDGTQELIARRSDWIKPVDTVPGLYVVRRESPEGGLWYARRGQPTLEPLSDEDGWDVRTYGPYLVWENYDGTWLTIPE